MFFIPNICLYILGIQAFADVYSCVELERAARQFVYQNFLSVAHTEEFLQLTEEKVISLLRSDQLHVMSEAQVFDAAYTWLTYDKSRTESACNILKHIKLGLLELPMLENIVIKSDFFRTCHKCQALVSSAIRCQYERKNMDLLTPRAHPPCIYVVAGRNSQDCQLRSMERYDFLSDTWSSVVIIQTSFLLYVCYFTTIFLSINSIYFIILVSKHLIFIIKQKHPFYLLDDVSLPKTILFKLFDLEYFFYFFWHLTIPKSVRTTDMSLSFL